MKIQILPNAETDLELGADFYESQRAGLGEYFVASLSTDIELLKQHGGIHEQYRGFHRSISKRFPFAIYYQLHNNTVFIYAILDCRRSPTTIENRLKDENA